MTEMKPNLNTSRSLPRRFADVIHRTNVLIQSLSSACHAQLLAVTIRVVWLVGFQLRLFCLVSFNKLGSQFIIDCCAETYTLQ
jgi:hypothetical protein